MLSRELINIISDAISQTEMLVNRSEDALSTVCQYVMQLLEASSFRMEEIVDNHSGDLGRPRCNIEKEKLHRLFDIYHSWTKLHQQTKKSGIWNDYIRLSWTSKNIY